VPAARQLYFAPGEYFDGLVADIDKALHEINLETYIFELDSVGNRVLAALDRAAHRGVRLRLLIDGVGSYHQAGAIARRLDSANCELRVFHPLPWDFALYRRALQAGRWYSQLLYLLASINRRDHRKLCVIDGKSAWLGSFNISDDHFNRRSLQAGDYWHDTGLRVSDSSVKILAANFTRVWQRKTESVGVRSRQFLGVEEISRRRQRKLHIMHVLELAAQRIWITNAYFNPTKRVLKILKRKAKQGVSVKLIVPEHSDIFFFPTLARTFYSDLLQANIRVFEYGESVLHSKTMLIDGQVLVGSTNLNYRSLFHDLELDLLLDDRELLQKLHNRFERDLDSSTEITLRNRGRHPLLLRPLGWLARFLRYFF